jgi:hypothetical protein
MPLGAARLNTLSRFVSVAAGPETRTAQTLTNVGTTFAAVPKFGTYGAVFNGSSQYMYLEGNDESVDFSGDFTIECWYYPTSLGSNDKIFDLRGINAVHSGGGDGTVALGDTLLIDQNSSDFRVFVDGADRSTASSGAFTINTWHHVCVQRQSGTINAWLNGTRYVDYAGSDDYSTVFAKNQPIGVNAGTTDIVSYLQGYMDEIRISTVARYTNGATITVPTSAFVNDPNTYCLFHLENNYDDDNANAALATGGVVTKENIGGTDYILHAFLDSGTFTPTTDITVDALLVGGGGGGGYCDMQFSTVDGAAGGGGAGQVVQLSSQSVSATGYTITIGAAGQGGTGLPNATNGGATSALGSTANGGGYGAYIEQSTATAGPNVTGGSGGGGCAGQGTTAQTKAGATGTYNGGSGAGYGTNCVSGGGGGGSAGNGENGSSTGNGGHGGLGTDVSSTFGTTYGVSGVFAGGGGGGAASINGSVSLTDQLGEAGGGNGARATSGNTNGTDATANTGSGGGGGASEDSTSNARGGDGGSGIVIIRYAVV